MAGEGVVVVALVVFVAAAMATGSKMDHIADALARVLFKDKTISTDFRPDMKRTPNIQPTKPQARQ